jgi:hypothetical protein
MGESAQSANFYLSVKVRQEFDDALRGFIEFEGCHNLTEAVQYLLEPFLAVCEETQGFSLHAEALNRPSFDGQIKLQVTEEFSERLDKQAAEYGIDTPGYTRIGLATSLRVHKQRVPKGEIVKKEVLKRFLIEDWRSRWANGENDET